MEAAMRSSRASLVAIGLFLCAAPSLAQPPGFPPPAGALPASQMPGAPARPGLPPRDPSTPAAPATGTAVMRGRIISATGSPLRRAQVNVSSTTPAANTLARRSVTTDGEGRWEITDLPAGRYTLSASKAGYVTMSYGQRRPFEPGKQVVIEDSQKLEQLDLTLQRGGVVAGRVTDEFGEPVASIGVQAMRYTYSDDGQRRLTAVSSGLTDDLGQFRVFGLMPGEYIVSAAMNGLVVIGGQS